MTDLVKRLRELTNRLKALEIHSVPAPWRACEPGAETPLLFGPDDKSIATWFWREHPNNVIATANAEREAYSSLEWIAEVKNSWRELWTLIERAADALESAGELPEHEGSCHTRLDTPRQVHACNCDWPKRMRTAYSALAARLEKVESRNKNLEIADSSLWQLADCINQEIRENGPRTDQIFNVYTQDLRMFVKRLVDYCKADAKYRLTQAESRIAELERDAEKISLYDELIYAVGNKYPDETRHQTALRYIGNAETIAGSDRAAKNATVDPHTATDKGEG